MKDALAILTVAAILVCGWLGKPESVFNQSKAQERINVVR